MAVLKAMKRDELGTRKVRRLRKSGMIPGIVYGHGEQTQPVTLSEHDVELAILHGERLLELDLDGKKQNVLIKDVQYDTFGHEVLHVDLTRVRLDERVEVTVPIVLKGTPEGVTSENGVLEQISSEVRIECAVQSIPEDITYMVTEMKVGDLLNMGKLPLPEGAKLLDDADAPVATVSVIAEPLEEPSEEEKAPEPEVIGEKEAPEAEGETKEDKG